MCLIRVKEDDEYDVPARVVQRRAVSPRRSTRISYLEERRPSPPTRVIVHPPSQDQQVYADYRTGHYGGYYDSPPRYVYSPPPPPSQSVHYSVRHDEYDGGRDSPSIHPASSVHGSIRPSEKSHHAPAPSVHSDALTSRPQVVEVEVERSGIASSSSSDTARPPRSKHSGTKSRYSETGSKGHMAAAAVRSDRLSDTRSRYSETKSRGHVEDSRSENHSDTKSRRSQRQEDAKSTSRHSDVVSRHDSEHNSRRSASAAARSSAKAASVLRSASKSRHARVETESDEEDDHDDDEDEDDVRDYMHHVSDAPPGLRSQPVVGYRYVQAPGSRRAGRSSAGGPDSVTGHQAGPMITGYHRGTGDVVDHDARSRRSNR